MDLSTRRIVPIIHIDVTRRILAPNGSVVSGVVLGCSWLVLNVVVGGLITSVAVLHDCQVVSRIGWADHTLVCSVYLEIKRRPIRVEKYIVRWADELQRFLLIRSVARRKNHFV